MSAVPQMGDVPVRSRRWPRWVKLLIVLALLALAVPATRLVIDALAWRAYNRAMGEARAIGGPVTFEEIEAARMTLPDAENGALVILSLKNLEDIQNHAPALKDLPIVGGAEFPLGRKWPEPVEYAVRDFLASRADDLKQMDRLLGIRRGRFLFRVTPDPCELYDNNDRFKPLWPAARLKSLDIVHRAMQSDTRSLVGDLQILLRLGELIQDQPFLLPGLVHVNVDRWLVCTLEQVLAQGQLGREQIQQIDPLLRTIESENRLNWAIRGERAFGIATGEWLRSGHAIDQLVGYFPIPKRLLSRTAWVLRQEAVLLDWSNSILRGADSKQRLQIASEQEKESERLAEGKPLVGVLAPSYRRCLELDLRTIALARCARVALAAELYRMDKGGFASRIEQLLPDYLKEAPLDPFDDRPLRYRVDTEGVVIYSVGEDLADDNGHIDSRVQPFRRIREVVAQSNDVGLSLLTPGFRGRTADTSPASGPALTTNP